MKDMKVEKEEAIRAGRRALDSLYRVQQELNSAKNWGLVDLFGGGGLISLIKHTKISSASSLCYQARRDLEDFERELKDVLFLDRNLDVNIGALLTFLDFFSDDVFSDFLVQRRINQARKNVEDAINTVRGILERL